MAVEVVIGIAIGCLTFFACFFVALCKERPYGKAKVVHLLGLIEGQQANGIAAPDLYVVRRAVKQAQAKSEAASSANPAPMQKQVAGRKR